MSGWWGAPVQRGVRRALEVRARGHRRTHTPHRSLHERERERESRESSVGGWSHANRVDTVSLPHVGEGKPKSARLGGRWRWHGDDSVKKLDDPQPLACHLFYIALHDPIGGRSSASAAGRLGAMVVCQFFLRGACRFGSQCRNEVCKSRELFHK